MRAGRRSPAVSSRRSFTSTSGPRSSTRPSGARFRSSPAPSSTGGARAQPTATAEYWDRGFLELVHLGHHAADLQVFWPTGGPHWDALAVVARPGDTRPGVLLVESKSYPTSSSAAARAPGPGRNRASSSRSRSPGPSEASVLRVRRPRTGAGACTKARTGSPTSAGSGPWVCAPGSSTCSSPTTVSAPRPPSNGVGRCRPRTPSSASARGPCPVPGT